MNNPLATRFDHFLKERTYLHNVSPRTLVWYRIAFNNYVETLPDNMGALPTKSTLERFVIAQRERGLRPVTCNTYIAAMNAFCRWLHEERDLPEPLKLKKLRVEQRILPVLTDTQMRQLLSFRPKTFRQVRTHLAVTVVLDTGLRISELLNLKRDDVDFDNLVLKVFGKGRKERLVPFSPELRKRFYRYEQLKARKDARSEFVFAGFGGARWEKRNSATSLYLLQEKLTLPMFRWHRNCRRFARFSCDRDCDVTL